MKGPIGLLSLWLLFVPAPPAFAAMGGGAAEPPQSGDPDFAKGRAAFDRQDWSGVIKHMTVVVLRRPWDDDAHNAMGFAHRKLGDYGRALGSYHRALQLNPHHRQALEYLGEAYLELDRPERATEVLERLRAACRRLDPGQDAGDRDPDCEEWKDLSAAILDYEAKPAE